MTSAATCVECDFPKLHYPAMSKALSQTDPRAIGERIVLTREAMGMSAAEFARFLGFGTQALSNYETGLRRPSLDQAFVIVQKAGVTLDWIYLGDVSGLPLRITSKLTDAVSMRRAS